jgi:hypothetical protein
MEKVGQIKITIKSCTKQTIIETSDDQKRRIKPYKQVLKYIYFIYEQCSFTLSKKNIRVHQKIIITKYGDQGKIPAQQI